MENPIKIDDPRGTLISGTPHIILDEFSVGTQNSNRWKGLLKVGDKNVTFSNSNDVEFLNSTRREMSKATTQLNPTLDNS